MKIIETTTTPDNIKIQLEDWSEHNTPEYPTLYGLTIGAYPIAKNTSRYKWVQGGQSFRLSISMNEYAGYTNSDVRRDFEALKTGEKTLSDLQERFWNGDRDKWYLGLIDREPV